MRDFAPVSRMAQVPVALVVNPSKIDAKDLAGFLAAGAQVARRDQHRLVRPRHDPAPRDRAAAAAHRHPADACALSRRRSGAAGPDGGPDRRHLRAAQHRVVLCPVRPSARRSPSRRRSASRCCPTCRPSPRRACRTSTSAPGTACSRPRPRRPPTLDTLHAAIQAALADPTASGASGPTRGRARPAEPPGLHRVRGLDEVERWSAHRAARSALPMECVSHRQQHGV